MTSYVIHALVAKRAELSGDIENTHNALKRMIQELEHLDKTLLMFDPDYQVVAIKPKAFRPLEDWSKRGEMTRRILYILRKASEPMTTQPRWRGAGGQPRRARGLSSSEIRRCRPEAASG